MPENDPDNPPTAEQEIEMFERLRKARAAVRKHLDAYGLRAQLHVKLARSILEKPRIVSKFVTKKRGEERKRYLEELPALCAELEAAASAATRAYQAFVAQGGK